MCEPEANKKRPANPYDAQFSTHYTIAASLVKGRFTLAELTDEAIATFQEKGTINPETTIYAPIAGTVVEANADLETTPELVNRDPYGAGWISRRGVHGVTRTKQRQAASTTRSSG